MFSDMIRKPGREGAETEPVMIFEILNIESKGLLQTWKTILRRTFTQQSAGYCKLQQNNLNKLSSEHRSI